MTTDLPPFFSPKRKREPSESDYYSPSPSPTSVVSIGSPQETRFREEEVGRHSPRAAVAGRFGELAIRGERLTTLGRQNADLQPEPTRPPEQRLGAAGKPENMSGYQPALELPPTPNDIPTAAVSPSRRKSTQPRKQLQPRSPSKTRKQRMSPPPTELSKEDPFTWHDYEITGHDPTDPTDDGYGINGIGFRPTAAIAWARSQKRQRQVTEWKNREAREARGKRRERRHESGGLERIHSIQQGSVPKRVKFDVSAETPSRDLSPP
ncbi:hypothetical protein N7490_011290 [Penicillium lividum]|nr:hypothetical protein N7490_011290 [Penicillium lividum]